MTAENEKPTSGNKRPSARPTTASKPAQKPKLTQNLISLLTAAAAAAETFHHRNDLYLLPSQSLSLSSLISSLPIPIPTLSPSPPLPLFHRLLSSSTSVTDPRFSLFFRVSKPTFFHLLSLLSVPSSSLAAALFRLSHAAPFKSLTSRFGFDSESSACHSFYTVCKLINEKLGHLLNVPQYPNFSPNLPNCCGVLGFGRFDVSGELLGPNGALIVQAIVDEKGRFVDISAGWPSKMSFDSIFRQSKLFSRVEESGSFLNGNCYVLGDSRLPLLPWVITPYNLSSSNEEEEDSFGSAQREFNNVHSRAMRVVERAFASVKSRWHLLGRKWKQESVEFFPFVLTAGCLLHNFLINCGDDFPDDGNDVVGMRNEEVDEEELPEFEGEVDFRARRLRDALAENLSWVSLRR